MNKYVIYNCPLIELNLLDGNKEYINPVVEASSIDEAKNILYNSFLQLNFPYSGNLTPPNEWVVKNF